MGQVRGQARLGQVSASTAMREKQGRVSAPAWEDGALASGSWIQAGSSLWNHLGSDSADGKSVSPSPLTLCLSNKYNKH